MWIVRTEWLKVKTDISLYITIVKVNKVSVENMWNLSEAKLYASFLSKIY